VVWEGRSREAPPYPDLWHIATLRGNAAQPSLSERSGHRSNRVGENPRRPWRARRGRKDGKTNSRVLYVLALAAVVVGVDVLFFRNRFWERLMVNVGIVLVFWAFYLRFLKPP
jgi:hypothetical protein